MIDGGDNFCHLLPKYVVDGRFAARVFYVIAAAETINNFNSCVVLAC
jgi:hypothetical protein